jgi:uncharacterized membrane protein YhaH (DUF805 family)
LDEGRRLTAKVSISAHFKRLLDFTGREDRSSFWPYAAVVFGIVMVVSMVIMVPMIMQFMDASREIAAEGAKRAYVDRGDGTFILAESSQRPDPFSTTFIASYLGITFGLSLLLHGAAIVRRLRDAGRSVFWSLLPIPFIIYSSIQMPRLFGRVGERTIENQALFFSVFISNGLYNIALIILIVLLAQKSKIESGLPS